MIDVVAAIVARNGGALLREAASDLAAAVGAPNVLVIDNASNDGSTADLAVEVQRQTANLGYAAGANRALTWAAQRGAAALLLLNQDARLGPDDARLMIELLASDPNLGAVFAKVVQRDRPYLLDGLLGRRNLRHKLTTGLGAGRIDDGRPARPLAVHHGHGAALLLRVSAAREVGGFDERLFAYHDEVDLCWRLARAHWGVALEPRAVARHVGPDADANRRRAKNYLLARNSLLVARKNAGWCGGLRVAVWALAATLLYYGPTALAGNADSRALLQGWVDGLLNREARRSVLSTL
jgi:GT2 family glycosyltransferase